MRKIEAWLADRIVNRLGGVNYNTATMYDEGMNANGVWIHHNFLGYYDYDDKKFVPYYPTIVQFPTTLTRRRLCTLGCDAEFYKGLIVIGERHEVVSRSN